MYVFKFVYDGFHGNTVFGWQQNILKRVHAVGGNSLKFNSRTTHFVIS